MNKQTVRIAQVKGFVVKKRCRKQEFMIVDGIGLTNEEAIQNLKINFAEARQNWKDSRFSEAIIYDATRNIYEGYSSITRPLMPNASDNLQTFEFVA